MRFHVTHRTINSAVAYDWTIQGSPPEYPVLARAPRSYTSEQDARSGIARARKAMQGYKFAKVVVDDGEE